MDPRLNINNNQGRRRAVLDLINLQGIERANNNSRLLDLPIEIILMIFDANPVFTNEDLAQLDRVSPLIAQIVHNDVRPVHIDHTIDLDQFIEFWERNRRRFLVETIIYRDNNAQGRRPPLRNDRESREILRLFLNFTTIEISNCNPYFILQAICIVPNPLEYIHVDWATVVNRPSNRQPFFTANYAHRQTITRILLPTNGHLNRVQYIRRNYEGQEQLADQSFRGYIGQFGEHPAVQEFLGEDIDPMDIDIPVVLHQAENPIDEEDDDALDSDFYGEEDDSNDEDYVYRGRR